MRDHNMVAFSSAEETAGTEEDELEDEEDEVGELGGEKLSSSRSA